MVRRSSLTASAADRSGGRAGRALASNLARVEALQSELGATRTARGTLVSLPGDVLFDFDRATLLPSARATLDTLAELIAAQNPAGVAIEGHTDNVGEDAYNDALSRRRAEAVRDYLANVGDAANVDMAVRGFGERRPAAPNQSADGEDDPEARRRNRRVEVILMSR